MKIQSSYLPGDRIGERYRVDKALAGGMGEVFLCFDEKDATPIALKTFQLRYDAPGLKEAFFEEVGYWIKLDKHPNIVRCYYMDTVDDRPFMFLDWVANDEARGTSLRDWLQPGKLDDRTALGFTIDILRGLKHAGEKFPGIVHRDLKPENILLGQNRIAKITDFGLATIGARTELVSSGADESELRRSISLKGGIAGTPLYMAPEQWDPEAKLGGYTDLYAVGCIFYEMLTGQYVYQALTTSELRRAHCHAALPSLSEIVWAADFLQHCLAKDRRERFANVGDALAAAEVLHQSHFGQACSVAPTPAALEAFDLSNRGSTLARLGRREEALIDLNQSIHLAPDFAQAYYNRGVTLHELRRREEALIDLNQAIHLAPDFAQAYYNRGVVLDGLGRRKEALEDYSRAIYLYPNDAKAYSNRGVMLAEMGRREEALTDLNQAIRLDPTLAQTYSNRGVVLAKMGRREEALTDLNQAIRLDSNNPKTYFNRGDVLDDMRRREEALVDYSQAIRLDPSFAQAHSNRGVTLAALGRQEEALADYSQAIRLDPNDAKVHTNRGVTLAALGRQEEAVADYSQAIRLDPNYAKAYYNRGNVLDDLGQWEEALVNYCQAIRLDPNYVKAYINLGVLHANLGQLDQALPFFERAAMLEDATGAQYAARARQKLGLLPAQNPAQVAFEAFQKASTFPEMRAAVSQHHMLTVPEFIAEIELVIQQQVPLQARPELNKRLIWLKQIAGNQ